MKRKIEDCSATIRDHYNSHKQQDITERQKSDSLIIRNFNNWVKSSLLNKCTTYYNTYRVLDLCCGRGGDLSKYKNSKNINSVVGIDISYNSLNDARIRYNDMINKNIKYRLKLIASNCFDTKSIIFNNNTITGSNFDLVSCQFAFHYCFSDEKMVRSVLSTISSVLQPGGYFIITIPDSRVIEQRLKNKLNNNDEVEWHNSLCSIKLLEQNSNTDIFRNSYGVKYLFSLIDSVTNCPEYIVPLSLLRSLCLDYELDLVLRQNFKEFYTTNYSNNKNNFFYVNLFNNYFSNITEIDNESWEVISLYVACCFRKRCPISHLCKSLSSNDIAPIISEIEEKDIIIDTNTVDKSDLMNV